MSYQNSSITETTSTSWFTRIKNSVVGVLFGLLLLVAGVVGLFWNEGRAVTTARSLEEGAGIVMSVAADRVDAANEGKLIHVTGSTTTDSKPSDADFGIVATGLRLERTVEMYQWKETSKSETKEKLGGGTETVTTYTYSTDWSSRPIDSSRFKQAEGHTNPPMSIQSETYQVPAAKLGAFDLSPRVIGMIGGDKPVELTPDMAPAITDAYAGTRRVAVADGRIYLGWDYTAPRIGDYRIGYSLVPLGPVSIVGEQRGSGFEPYQTKAGRQLLMVSEGTVAADVMFADAISGNRVLTWILRLVGLVALFIAFSLVMAPLGVLASVIPFLGNIVRMGTGLVAFALAVLVGAVTIAIAWFFFRPLLSLGIIVVGAAIPFVAPRMARSRQAEAPPADPEPA